METQRKRRRHRQRYANQDPLQITQNDVEIFTYLARYRYLTPELLALLTGNTDKQYTTRRLRRLLDHHYVIQYQDPENKLSLHWPDFYMLDELGEQYLLENDLHPYDIARLFRQEHDIAAPNFVHDFAACNVIASIEIAVKAAGLEFIPTFEIFNRAGPTAKPKLPCTVAYTFPDGTRQTINDHFIPDGGGPFGIRQADGKVSFFALELEKGTPIEPTKDLKRSSTLKKILAYKDAHKQGVYRTHWGIPNLRTLFVTKSNTRAQTMQLMAERVAGPTNQFLFGAIDLTRPNHIEHILTRDWLRAGHPPTPLI